MGKTCGKTQTRRSEDLSSNSAEKNLTADKFYTEFRKQLSDDDLNELSAMFQMIDISPEDVSKCLYKFMGTKRFKRIFKEELSNLKYKLSEVDKNTESSTTYEHLMKHCFAVLYMYLEIIENVYNANNLNDILIRIAMGHGFLMNIKHEFKMHNYLFQRFLRNEFEKYVDKATFSALRRYMSLITERIIVLAEHYNKDLNFDNIIEILTHQKGLINSRLSRQASLSEIYINPSQSEAASEISFIRDEHGVFPGTSVQKLDKERRLRKIRVKHKK